MNSSAQNKQDIIIAGVGGQGILTVSGLIGLAAVECGLHIKQSEVHGMAQRGGAVVSHLRLSRDPIHSDLIPHGAAHLIVAMEPMEGLRYLHHARHDTLLIASQVHVKNIPDYPDAEKVIRRIRAWPHHVVVDAEKLARSAGNLRTVNSVMLGAASDYLMIPPETLRRTVEGFFASKGAAVVEQNLKAFDLGRAASH